MLQELGAQLAPHIAEAAAIIGTAIVAYVAKLFRDWVGLSNSANYAAIEEKHMRTLQSAIRSGVMYAMEGGDIDPGQIAAKAIAYAKESAPDAIGFLVPGDSFLAKLARAKITELATAAK